mmetsp:Transcript_123762/g.214556  ORF Transcript_123762/g.214556 Transcript_123762/m.214556 type:complete len:431 (+) Transcript_123762:43-1335(+)
MQRRERNAATVAFRSDFDKLVLLQNFERRCWQRVYGETDEDWNFYWASVHSVRQIFNPDTGRRLGKFQIINHFPNHYELTRKDLMVKNIKRYRKEREKQESLGPNGDERFLGTLAEVPPEWVPTTFALPNDYALFVEEFRRNPNETWIAKPTGKAQGRGIFLVSKLQQLKKWSTASQKTPFSQPTLPFRDSYIISRYINDPLLVGGKKFDMRLYVLVTSYRPLKVYLYKGGFCRFCVEQYTTDVAEFDNVFIHLTNVAIQKNAEDYNDKHGGKWDMNDLMLFIEGIHGKAAADKLATDMESVIIHSLKAVQAVMINDKHCFELYGFDVLIDRSLRPWLLEVNASPSLVTTTEDDRLLKTRLIYDMLTIVMPPGSDLSTLGARTSSGPVDSEVLGSFVCIFDEAREKQIVEEAREQGREKRKQHARPGGWR